MSDGISTSFVDFAGFSFEIDCVRCVSVRSFLVRNCAVFPQALPQFLPVSPFVTIVVRFVTGLDKRLGQGAVTNSSIGPADPRGKQFVIERGDDQ
jgi:hypothetical protein